MAPAPDPAAVARSRSIRNVLLGILVANWAVAAAKLVLGLIAGSAALTGDGLHSFIDGASNVVGLVAMRIASRPADEDHPYGHGKFEALASLAIGGMIGAAMLELGRMAIHALVSGTHPEVRIETIAITVVTLIINLAVTFYERRVGRRLQSPILVADAQHTLSDVFVSLSVLVSLVLSYLKVPRVDGGIALLVLVMVARVAYRIIREAAGSLADEVRLDAAQVVAACLAIDQVASVKRVRSRGMEHHVYVDLIIEVDPGLPLARAHALSHQVEDAIRTRFPQVTDVVVHIEPQDLTAPA